MKGCRAISADSKFCLRSSDNLWRQQGGPDSSGVKNDPYFNQWEDLDDSPIGWHITEVCPFPRHAQTDSILARESAILLC